MVTADDLRAVSGLAADVMSEIMEAQIAAESYLTGDPEFYANCFIKHLYGTEDAVEAWQKSPVSTIEIDERFEAVALPPENLDYSKSAHDAILLLGLRIVGGVSDAIGKDGLPGHFQPGVQYISHPLVAESDILPRIDIALAAFNEACPTEEKLNWWSMARAQELARAIVALPASNQTIVADGSITLEDAVKLMGGSPTKGVLQNKLSQTTEDNKPRKSRQGKGRASNIYEYRSLRAWIAATWPDAAGRLPENYSEAMSDLAKMSASEN